jgi:hypothetical protein
MTTLKVLFCIFLCIVTASCASYHSLADSELVRVGKSSIRLETDANLPVPREAIVDWVRRAATAATFYLGRFPVRHLVLRVHGGREERVSEARANPNGVQDLCRVNSDSEPPVGEGVTYGSSSVDVRLGQNVTVADLNRDWVLTHEMFHLAFPALDVRYVWMMEGLSDYLEPVARVQAGQLSASDMWLEFVQGLPKGLPMPGENGLDSSTRRERIYWGGSIYWLLADVNIRVRTNNRHGLDDAIRAILNAGGDGGAIWPLERVLVTGDNATGTTVLADLYKQLGKQRGDVDLDDLWKKLGVQHSPEAVTFDDSARWSQYRAAITTPENNIP